LVLGQVGGYIVEFFLRVVAETFSFGQILAQQNYGVFVDTAL
jgi:hypothetical protein